MLGERLLELRLEKNLTQKELGEKFHISSVRYGHYENNRREPDIDLLIDFAQFYNVSVDYLIGNTKIRNLDEVYSDETFILLNDLDEIDKAEIRGMMKIMLKQEKYNKKSDMA